MIRHTDMEVNILIEEGVEAHLEVGWLRKVAEQVLTAEGISPTAELSLAIVSQERVQELNRNYLGRDEPTDVIAFPMIPGKGDHTPFVSPPDGMLHLGEVIISYPQARIQAEEQGHSIEKEMTILLIHGILHLLGYEDEKPEFKGKMMAREEEILSYIEGKQG